MTTAFPALAARFLRLFMDVHHRTRRMSPSLSLSLSFSLFYLHTQRRVYRRLPLGLSKSEFSASTTYPPIRSRRSASAASFSLSLVVSFYLFFTLSLRLFPQTCPRSVSFLRPVSPMVATSEFESRRVEGLSRRGRGVRGEKRTLSKCYPLGPSLPLLLLSFFLSLALPCRLFFSSFSPDLSVPPPVERRSTYRRTA